MLSNGALLRRVCRRRSQVLTQPVRQYGVERQSCVARPDLRRLVASCPRPDVIVRPHVVARRFVADRRRRDRAVRPHAVAHRLAAGRTHRDALVHADVVARQAMVARRDRCPPSAGCLLRQVAARLVLGLRMRERVLTTSLTILNARTTGMALRAVPPDGDTVEPPASRRRTWKR